MLKALHVIEDSLHDESQRDRSRAAIAALNLAGKAVRDREVDRRLHRIEDVIRLLEEESPW